MATLLLCEIKKYKNTYISILAFLGVLSSVVLLAIAFTVAKDDFLAQNAYNWYSFSTRLIESFVFLLGPLITCFIATSSVFYEYQCKTMKNMITTPHSRTAIIVAKMIYVAAFIMLLYICVALANIVCGMLLGFPITVGDAISYSSYFLLAGVSTIVIVPLSMLITLKCKSFIPAMVISVAGIIPNMSAYHWNKCYLSPWAAPEILVLAKAGFVKTDIIYPEIAASMYFIIFTAAVILYFNHADQHG